MRGTRENYPNCIVEIQTTLKRVDMVVGKRKMRRGKGEWVGWKEDGKRSI